MANLTSLGVTVGYGTGTLSTKPDSMKVLDGCKSIPGLKLDTEKIDVSTLADTVKQYAAGETVEVDFYRADSSHTVSVVFDEDRPG
jgi:hypothetical protein